MTHKEIIAYLKRGYELSIDRKMARWYLTGPAGEDVYVPSRDIQGFPQKYSDRLARRDSETAVISGYWNTMGQSQITTWTLITNRSEIRKKRKRKKNSAC